MRSGSVSEKHWVCLLGEFLIYPAGDGGGVGLIPWIFYWIGLQLLQINIFF